MGLGIFNMFYSGSSWTKSPNIKSIIISDWQSRADLVIRAPFLYSLVCNVWLYCLSTPSVPYPTKESIEISCALLY